MVLVSSKPEKFDETVKQRRGVTLNEKYPLYLHLYMKFLNFPLCGKFTIATDINKSWTNLFLSLTRSHNE